MSEFAAGVDFENAMSSSDERKEIWRMKLRSERCSRDAEVGIVDAFWLYKKRGKEKF